MEINVKQAQVKLSQLIQAAIDGETVVITNHGKPVARLIGEPKAAKKPAFPYGCMRDQLSELGDSWDTPEANAAIAALFDIANARTSPL